MLTSISSGGSSRPTSLDLHKVYDFTKQPLTEAILLGSPPRTRRKKEEEKAKAAATITGNSIMPKSPKAKKSPKEARSLKSPKL